MSPEAIPVHARRRRARGDGGGRELAFSNVPAVPADACSSREADENDESPATPCAWVSGECRLGRRGSRAGH
eukprot:2040953-Prymnesium_polylepis.1